MLQQHATSNLQISVKHKHNMQTHKINIQSNTYKAQTSNTN